MRRTVLLWLAVAGATPLGAQTGAVAGHVRDAVNGGPLAGVRVTLGEGQQGGVTDDAGAYRIREVRSGTYRVRAALIGYQPAVRDSVLVLSGTTVVVDFVLAAQAVPVAGVTVEAQPDPVLDPLVTATIQRIDPRELRRLPVTTLEEAVALSAGAVGESYRGGRLGQTALILDGLGVKNQLDASTGPLGLRLPPDLLTEASLVTNGFSARYGQALSGMVNAVTRDPGEGARGRLAYETDRPLGKGGDYGLDRVVATAEGPLGPVGFLAGLELEGRLDADPVHAPPPADPRDPRHDRPFLLPHNSAERVDGAGKLVAAVGRYTVRLLGLRSVEQRLLYDPAYKYDAAHAPARRVTGDLWSLHVARAPRPESAHPLNLDVRLGYFARDFFRGALAAPAPYAFGAFTGRRFTFLGEGMARAQDTASARSAVPGFVPPEFSARTPWGVPAFFLGDAPRGEIAWNRFRELRGQLDAVLGLGLDADLLFGAEVGRQRVETFQRALAFAPVGDTVPAAAAADFAPLAAAAYLETVFRLDDLALTLGIRYDQFDARADVAGGAGQARRTINPRFAVSTVLKGATFVASWGRFSQAPDYQFLVDAAFDDTLRTGRFRRGNPNLGFEQATQYEFSVRARPSETTALRVNAYVKQLDGLIASVPLGVDPDSTIFGNSDYGTVRGAELLFERELRDGWGARIAYTLQQAQATATNAFQLLRRIRLDSLGDTINPARVDFPLDYDRRHGLVVVAQGRVADGAGPRLGGVRPFAALEAAAVFRYSSGLPFSRTNATGDTLIGLPNSHRLPSQSMLDVLLRRPVALGGFSGSVYLDVRNLLNRRNLEAVRRDSGDPALGVAELAARAQAAYAAHPEPIPYESPRYRAWADADGNGLVEGPGELLPLFVAAATDYHQPLFAYAPPRLFRFGVELEF